MPVLTERKLKRPPISLACGGIALLCLLLGVVAWSWFVSPVSVPLGPHAVGFGQLYTAKRPPPPGRRRMGLLGNPRARIRTFRVGGGIYLIGWR